jgi:LysR family transcriptional regulator, hydrogen peroxide-inducible genes activator
MRHAPYPFTLRQLQYVVAVADEKSFRKAAEKCHVAQPSLSAQISQVEEAIGAQLFERDTKQVALTQVGEELVARARAVLAVADELVESGERHSDPLSGSLRLGMIPTVGPYLLPEVAGTLRKKYPKLRFVWQEGKTETLVEQLARAELDGAVLALEAQIGDLRQVVLGRDPFVFAASPKHPLAGGGKPVKADDLEGEHVLVLDDGHCFRDQALSFCARAGAEEAAYRATSLATLVQMAAAGDAVTLLPSLAVSVENRRKDLVLRPFAKPVPVRTLALVFRKRSALSTALEAVGATLAESYQALVARPAK